MAFLNKNLSVIAYANGFTMWHYAGGETLSAISAGGYFDDASSLMNAGDVMIVNGSDSIAMKKITATSPAVTIATL
jgi:hypothetical protein